MELKQPDLNGHKQTVQCGNFPFDHIVCVSLRPEVRLLLKDKEALQ